MNIHQVNLCDAPACLSYEYSQEEYYGAILHKMLIPAKMHYPALRVTENDTHLHSFLHHFRLKHSFFTNIYNINVAII